MERSTVKQKFIRVTVYISPQEHRLLKSKLALQGLTISEWFRRMAAKESDEDDS